MREFNPMKEYFITVKICKVAIPIQIALFLWFIIPLLVIPTAKEIKKGFEVSPGPDFTDPRDGKVYKTVKISEQTWMAQNLDFHGEDGYLGLCYGDEPKKKIRKPVNCEIYGRLYDWDEAMEACPKGWHLPSREEWEKLTDFIGDNAGTKLKAVSGWNSNGTDNYGFTALPGGNGRPDGSFDNVGNYGNWWSTSEYGSDEAYRQAVGYDRDVAGWISSGKDYLFSVRCVKDSSYKETQADKKSPASPSDASEKSSFTDSRDSKKYKSVKIGSQTWMAENLNYNANGSKCYDNNPDICAKYGRLYNWATALKACPKGWHLPSNEEWTALMEFLASNKKDVRYGKTTQGESIIEYYENAGKHLKANSGWKENGNGTDDYGFSALPGGGGRSDGSFSTVGGNGYWWGSASESNSDGAYIRYMGYDGDSANLGNYGKDYLFSVRCLKD